MIDAQADDISRSDRRIFRRSRNLFLPNAVRTPIRFAFGVAGSHNTRPHRTSFKRDNDVPRAARPAFFSNSGAYMSKFLRKTVTAVAIATALAGAGVVSAADQKPAGNPAMTAPGMAAKPAADTSAIDAKFKGDKKAEYSYMVGMDVGRGLTSIKDEVDVSVVIQALQATLKGEKTTLTEPEALSIRQEFMQKL